MARLRCGKDRAGTYATGQHVADLHIGPDIDGTAQLWTPDRTITASGTFRPTGLMEKVSRALEQAPEAASYRGIQDRVTGKKEYVRLAVDALVAEGYLSTAPGARGATLHSSAKPYRETDDDCPRGTVALLTAPQSSVDCPRPLGGGTGDSQ